MQLRRVVREGRVELQERAPGGWVARADHAAVGGPVFADSWLLAAAERQMAAAGRLLPVQPLSFRDFMLYERHAIDAARGLVRRLHPFQHRVAVTAERLTRRPFPLFRPSALFYRQPVYYMSNAMTFVPSGAAIVAPPYSGALDYELELGFVLAAPLLDATPDEALAAIGAFVVVNDLSARDVQRAEMASGFGPQKSKHFAGSMSETAVTAGEILPRLDRLTGSVTVNGTTVSRVSSAGMRWGLGEALAHASRGERLLPGELFATGTLPGGSGMETGTWLAPGDTVRLALDGVGEIVHRVTGR